MYFSKYSTGNRFLSSVHYDLPIAIKQMVAGSGRGYIGDFLQLSFVASVQSPEGGYI